MDPPARQADHQQAAAALGHVGEQRCSATFATHFPGFLTSLEPDAVTLFWYWPDGADRTHTVEDSSSRPR